MADLILFDFWYFDLDVGSERCLLNVVAFDPLLIIVDGILDQLSLTATECLIPVAVTVEEVPWTPDEFRVVDKDPIEKAVSVDSFAFKGPVSSLFIIPYSLFFPTAGAAATNSAFQKYSPLEIFFSPSPPPLFDRRDLAEDNNPFKDLDVGPWNCSLKNNDTSTQRSRMASPRMYLRFHTAFDIMSQRDRRKNTYKRK